MTTQTSPIVTVRDLTKYFEDFCAVDHINFDVHQGECLGVLGPNGAGKTTTLRMLLGQTIPTGGTLMALGFHIPQEARQMRATVGVVPQQDNLDPEFSILENLYSYASYFGLRGPDLMDYLKELLAFAALEKRANRKVTELSGGMKRRLSLARALVNKPELLILDEPTTGLDPQARQLLWQRLMNLKAKGTTLILTTHYLEEAERLCDRVLIIDHGRILAEGAPFKLIHSHIEPHVMEIHSQNEAMRRAIIETLPAERFEVLGETVLCYCHDEDLLLQTLSHHPKWEFLHRRANLEDVFLKLTGHELRDN